MPPPPVPKQEIIHLTDDDDDDQDNEVQNKKPSQPIKTKFLEKSFTQHSISSPPVPILSQKINSSRTPIVLDLTDDDDDDFVETTSSYFSRPGKKLKST